MLYLKKAVAIEEEYALMNVMMIGVYILRLTNFLKPTNPNLSLTSLCNKSSSMQQLVQQKFTEMADFKSLLELVELYFLLKTDIYFSTTQFFGNRF